MLFRSWKKAEEIKGIGVKGEDNEGNIYFVGAKKILKNAKEDETHNIYVFKNDHLIGWIDVKDEIRPEAIEIIRWCQRNNINTIMLTGDLKSKAEKTAKTLGINEVYAEQSPAQKLEIISRLNNEIPTAMV